MTSLWHPIPQLIACLPTHWWCLLYSLQCYKIFLLLIDTNNTFTLLHFCHIIKKHSHLLIKPSVKLTHTYTLRYQHYTTYITSCNQIPLSNCAQIRISLINMMQSYVLSFICIMNAETCSLLIIVIIQYNISIEIIINYHHKNVSNIIYVK